jgi:hypothetical protein
MTFQLKKAIREQVNLIITLAGGTGSGKTVSAMRLATGLSGGKRFAVIDTENGRALHHADNFDFDCGQLRAPFSPMAYMEAIEAADAAGYPVIIVDSASHEHAGEGGLLDMHESELERLAGSDYKRREQCKMTAWIRPKGDHRRFVQKLLQVKAHLILCFRAESKIEVIKEDGKMKVVPKKSLVGLDGWVPICEKNLPFEATASFLLIADQPGIPHPIKLPDVLKPYFPPGQPIDEEAGRRVAAWAAGATDKPDTAAIAQAFKAIGWEAEAVDKTVGKPIAEWTPADVNIARQAYKKAAASKGATI